MSNHAILVTAVEQPCMMSRLTKTLADHQANITHVDIHLGTLTSGVYFEITLPDGGMRRSSMSSRTSRAWRRRERPHHRDASMASASS